MDMRTYAVLPSLFSQKIDFLATDLAGAAKSMVARRQEITAAASGDGLRERRMRIAAGNVVEWNDDGSCVRPGPGGVRRPDQ